MVGWEYVGTVIAVTAPLVGAPLTAMEDLDGATVI